MPCVIPSVLVLLSLATTPSLVPPPRNQQMIGFGLVVGLDGTGGRSTFTQQVMVDMKLRLGCIGAERFEWFLTRGMRDRPGPFRWPCDETFDGIMRMGNTSAVMVFAEIPSEAKKGDRTDLTVNSMDDASSLRGGQLLVTPLKGADGQVYLMGQGAIGVLAVAGQATSGTIRNGGLIERVVR